MDVYVRLNDLKSANNLYFWVMDPWCCTWYQSDRPTTMEDLWVVYVKLTIVAGGYSDLAQEHPNDAGALMGEFVVPLNPTLVVQERDLEYLCEIQDPESTNN